MSRGAVLAPFLVAAMTIGVLGCTSDDSDAGGRTIWVAPDGHDKGSGSKDSPFRTLDRARDEARSGSRGDVTVNLRGGTLSRRSSAPLRWS